MDETVAFDEQTPETPARPGLGGAIVVLLLTLVVVGACGYVNWRMPPDGQKRGDLLRFLGHFHPTVLHLPIGLLLLVPLLELLGLFSRWKHLHRAAGFVLGAGALAAVLTAAHGYLLAWADGWSIQSADAAANQFHWNTFLPVLGRVSLGEAGSAEELLRWHMWGGMALACLAMFTWCTRCLAVSRPLGNLLYVPMLIVMVAVLVVASHLGGSITHGQNYLTEYMPAPLRHLLHLPDKSAQPPVTVSADDPPDPPAGAADATVYTALVAPLLEQHCVKCHGPSKAKGKLRLDSYAGIVKGGEGPDAVMTPGDPGKSELCRRIALPSTDEDVMPPDGKARLSAEQVKLITWWVGKGAPADLKVSEVSDAPADVQKQLDAAKKGK